MHVASGGMVHIDRASNRCLSLLRWAFVPFLLLPIGESSIALGHHCAGEPNLPQYPNHSCKTRTQSYQTGESITPGPGGNPRREYPTRVQQQSSPPAAPGCIYDVDPGRISEILSARAGVCQRYSATQIVCDAETSQPAPGGSIPLTESWEQKLTRELQTEIEKRAATRRGFNRVPTQVAVTISPTNLNWNLVTNTPANTAYYNLAVQVLRDFVKNGKIRSPDSGTHQLTLDLGGDGSSPSPDSASQSSASACPYVPGQRLAGTVNENTTAQPTPTFGSGTDYGTGYPAPTAVPQAGASVQVLYGKAWRRPAGQTKSFPIDLKVPTSQPLNVYSEGEITAGKDGQYYNRFGGQLVRSWTPAGPGRTESFGAFRIETLYTVRGETETNVNITVPLGSIPPR